MAGRRRAVVFAYHNVGVRCLKVLLAGGVDVALVVTHEDSAGENIWFESVISLCQAEGIAYVTPPNANSPELLAQVAAAQPDLMFSFYYRNMLPAALLAVAPAFNMHGSLLPQFRGRAPVNWAVLHGATETGATLHEMTVKPDAGAIVAQSAVPILPDDTAFEVFGKVTVAAEQALWRVLPQLLDGSAPRTAQRPAPGRLFRRPQAGGRPHRLVAAGAAGVQPAPRGGAALPRRLHRRGGPPLHYRTGKIVPPRGLAICHRGWLWWIIASFGVCGDGRMLAISSLLADGAAVTPAQLQARLADPAGA